MQFRSLLLALAAVVAVTNAMELATNATAANSTTAMPNMPKPANGTATMMPAASSAAPAASSMAPEASSMAPASSSKAPAATPTPTPTPSKKSGASSAAIAGGATLAAVTFAALSL